MVETAAQSIFVLASARLRLRPYRAEALRMVLAHGFGARDLRRIEANVDPRNLGALFGLLARELDGGAGSIAGSPARVRTSVAQR